jgi:hypothetical protein
MWYCVHALFYFEYRDGNQDDYLVWENMYLIQATSPDEAKAKGEFQAMKTEKESEDDSLKLNERPARFKFAAIRKVVECQDLDEQTGRPTDGTEISYSEFMVSNKEDFSKLICASTATVDYIGSQGR